MRCPVQKLYLFFFRKTGKKREKGSEMYLEFRTCDVMGISSQSMKFEIYQIQLQNTYIC